MRALALGDLVPPRPEDSGSLAHHSEEQGALFSSLEHPRPGHARVAQPTEGRPERKAEQVGGSQKGGKGSRRTGVSEQPK
jgi:hypothetical protein